MSLRTLGRATLLAAVLAGLAPAPAHAASPPVVDVFCEALGRYRVLCERTITGGTAPYLTRWYYNGSYFAAYDGDTFTSWSCTLSGPNQYTAVVTDAAGLTATDSSSVRCVSGAP